MQYCLTYGARGGQSLIVHHDMRVSFSEEPTEYIPCQVVHADSVLTALARDIFEVRGITRVIINPYQIEVYKGRVFKWNDIVPKLLSTLLIALDVEGKAIEIDKPVGQKKGKSAQEQDLGEFSLSDIKIGFIKT